MRVWLCSWLCLLISAEEPHLLQGAVDRIDCVDVRPERAVDWLAREPAEMGPRPAHLGNGEDADGRLIALLPPGEAVVASAEATWQTAKGIVLAREVKAVQRVDPYRETLFLDKGRVRIESPDSTWVYNPARARVGLESADPSSPPHRPGLIDAIFGRPGGRLPNLLTALRINWRQVSFARYPTPSAPLPFVVTYRLGDRQRPDSPFLLIEKTKGHIRLIQFRRDPNGPLWRAEYDGFGAVEGIPSYLPTTIRVYRDGVPFETIHALRALSEPIPADAFRAPTGREHYE